MKLRHIALIGSLFPFLLAIVLFFGVLISAEDDDGGGGSSSWVTGMNLSAEVLKHQPMVEKYAKEYGNPSTSPICWQSYRWKVAGQPRTLCRVPRAWAYRLIPLIRKVQSSRGANILRPCFLQQKIKA